MRDTTLLAVPNVSEGRERARIRALADAFGGARSSVRLLDVHSDGDHHRSVFTLAGRPGALADAVMRGAAVAVEGADAARWRSARARPAKLDGAGVPGSDVEPGVVGSESEGGKISRQIAWGKKAQNPLRPFRSSPATLSSRRV